MKTITLKDISTLCSGMQYAQGFRHVKQGDVLTPWVGNRTIGGQIRNPVRPHTVRIRFSDGDRPSPYCTCSNHTRQSFCQHVAALLIAWATMPSSFARYNGPDTAPLVENTAARKEQDPLAAFGVALDRVEALLLDLLSHGLVTLNPGRVEVIRRTERLASSHGLGRIAVALAELDEQVGLLNRTARPNTRSQARFEAARYAQALNTAWHLTQAARQALDDGDAARLREIAALEFADEPALIRESAELVELTYHTSLNHRAATQTSYLLALDSGQLLAERAFAPDGRHAPGRKVSHRMVMRGRVAIYPASDVDEVVLLDVEAVEPPGPDIWQRAYAWAQTSGDALVARLRTVVARHPAFKHAHVWFAPARVLVHPAGISFLDETGASLAVEPAQAVGRVLLDAPVLAAFGTVGRAGDDLRFTALSLLTGGQVPDLVTLTG